jgi:hypothetical protein
MLLPCCTRSRDFPAIAGFPYGLEHCGLNFIALGTIRWATTWVKRDKATVIAKSWQ